MIRRRPIKIRTAPQPPRIPKRPPVTPMIGRPTSSPDKRLDNLGQRFLRSNQSTRTHQIPTVRTDNIGNIYKPNPNIRNIV